MQLRPRVCIESGSALAHPAVRSIFSTFYFP